MTSFAFHPAASLAEATALLAQYGDGTQLLAGGTSLMLLNRLGLLAPDHVVGLRDVGELRGIAVDDAGALRLGALTKLRDIETAPEVRGVPVLAEAAHHVATVRIRNQATLGGSLGHADPAQDVPPALIALDARVDVAGPNSTRQLPVEDLFTGYLETSLHPGELVTGVAVPRSTRGTRGGYLKFLPRTADDYATVSVAAVVDVVDGRVTRIRVALGAVAPTPVRAHSVEAALVDGHVTSEQLRGAAEFVRQDIDPTSDARGSASYKNDVAVVCVRRLLGRLLETEQEGR
ncbi:MAG: xanthine dehydrogenase family protein subunit M [Streptosporangiales bacterium]|nr:xanthine dehydrogenase family protein subunit M [Streptosporangiales bacterium]MBO0889288.1 xanthine dehydrogenase family protein subunit M [Acidothermales bacterium]